MTEPTDWRSLRMMTGPGSQDSSEDRTARKMMTEPNRQDSPEEDDAFRQTGSEWREENRGYKGIEDIDDETR